MKQITRAAALSVAIAGMLSIGMNVRPVSASEGQTAKPAAEKCIPPMCNPGGGRDCGIFN